MPSFSIESGAFELCGYFFSESRKVCAASVNFDWT